MFEPLNEALHEVLSQWTSEIQAIKFLAFQVVVPARRLKNEISDSPIEVKAVKVYDV